MVIWPQKKKLYKFPSFSGWVGRGMFFWHFRSWAISFWSLIFSSSKSWDESFMSKDAEKPVLSGHLPLFFYANTWWYISLAKLKKWDTWRNIVGTLRGLFHVSCLARWWCFPWAVIPPSFPSCLASQDHQIWVACGFFGDDQGVPGVQNVQEKNATRRVWWLS